MMALGRVHEGSGTPLPFSMLVMVTTLNDRDLSIIESLDQPVLRIDAPRPVTLVIEAQGFQFADTLRRDAQILI